MQRNNIIKAAGIAAAVVGTSIYLYRRYKANCAARMENGENTQGDHTSAIRQVLSRAKMAASR